MTAAAIGVVVPASALGKDIARGPKIRCYAGEPECNGVIERFMRTLKEQCILLHRFETLEEARWIITDFIMRYNTERLIQRFGYRTPAQAPAKARGVAP